MSTQQPVKGKKIKAVAFDFMGTCLDWHSSITSALPQELSEKVRSEFVLEWRHKYFDANAARVRKGEPPEDIDITHDRILQGLLLEDKHFDIKHLFTQEVQDRAIAAWHHQKAWDDVAEALRKLKEAHGFEIFVHANGTTRLQLDLVASSGLRFDMLFSSELLGVIKPAPENYRRFLKLIKREPEEVVLVAAHAYDTRGAKEVGMRTVYIRRWTDDIHEDFDLVRSENDAFLDDMTKLDEVIAGFNQ